MKTHKPSRLYRVIRGAVRICYPDMELIGAENISDRDVILVGNHAQMHGPIVSQLYLPGPPYTWSAGQMFNLREVPAYAYRDFWSDKPRRVRWLYKILSYLVAPLSVFLFRNANTIPVYHDNRLITAFRQTLAHLEAGERIMLFAENDEPYNHILCNFHEKFVDVARLYYKKTGRALAFVPVYTAPKLGKVVCAPPVTFDPHAPIEKERTRVCTHLKEQITRSALALPPHTVITFRGQAQSK